MDFGNLLRKERDRLGLSRREVAEKADISEQYIYDIEVGKKNPSIETVNKLAETYKSPGLLRKYMIMNDINVDAILENTLYDLCSHVESIVENDEEALEEWTEMVRKFIDKYERKKPAK